MHQELLSRLADPAPLSADALYRLGMAALDHDLGEAVIARLGPEVVANFADQPRLWQVLGLAHRSLQDSAAAHGAFVRAAALAPADPLLAHSAARTALEAGDPALALFDRARALAPADAAVMLGQAAARLAAGDGAAACSGLQAVLADNPGWLEGHNAFAKIAASAGLPEPTASLRAALSHHPRDPRLWFALIRVAMEAADYPAARLTIAEARTVLGESAELLRGEAISLSEQDCAVEAQALFERLPQPEVAASLIHPLRNLIRLGQFERALKLAERPFAPPEELELWPYRSLLWRLTGDARWEWLEGDERLIRTYDLGAELGDLAALAEGLRSVHRGMRQPLNQSVRGGSQTDGNLLARAEPEIRHMRAVLLDAVAAHVAQLPAPAAGHPTLIARRAPLRVAGAWSIRLTGQGFHVDHVHQQGWLSSCLYLALPAGPRGLGGERGTDGWLAFGECRALLPDFAGFRLIEPKAGLLALFPSLTWHGTRPFAEGERMTVAFDIARPPQA